MRVLICRLSSIGDCVQTLPVLCALRQHAPDAFIAWAVQPAAAPLLQHHECLDRLIVVDLRWTALPQAARKLWRQLRELRFDVTIDPQSLTKSSCIAALSGARHRIGFSRPQGRELSLWLNNRRVQPTATHVVDRHLELLAPLGIHETQARFGVPAESAAQARVEAFLRDAGLARGFAVLNPGAGWDSRLWPPERYAWVARHLAQRHAIPSLVLWAGERERGWAEEIVDASTGTATLAPATSLPELAAVARAARLFVASDTGPLHLAAAVGTPCVGLYGPTRPERSGAYGDRHIAVQAYYQAGTDRQRRRGDNAAMRAINVEDVARACDAMLQREPRAARAFAAD